MVKTGRKIISTIKVSPNTKKFKFGHFRPNKTQRRKNDDDLQEIALPDRSQQPAEL
jgi:hypothetical protein